MPLASQAGQEALGPLVKQDALGTLVPQVLRVLEAGLVLQVRTYSRLQEMASVFLISYEQLFGNNPLFQHYFCKSIAH